MIKKCTIKKAKGLSKKENRLSFRHVDRSFSGVETSHRRYILYGFFAIWLGPIFNWLRPIDLQLLRAVNVLSSECRSKVYFDYAESRETTKEVERCFSLRSK